MYDVPKRTEDIFILCINFYPAVEIHSLSESGAARMRSPQNSTLHNIFDSRYELAMTQLSMEYAHRHRHRVMERKRVRERENGTEWMERQSIEDFCFFQVSTRDHSFSCSTHHPTVVYSEANCCCCCCCCRCFMEFPFVCMLGPNSYASCAFDFSFLSFVCSVVSSYIVCAFLICVVFCTMSSYEACVMCVLCGALARFYHKHIFRSSSYCCQDHITKAAKMKNAHHQACYALCISEAPAYFSPSTHSELCELDCHCCCCFWCLVAVVVVYAVAYIMWKTSLSVHDDIYTGRLRAFHTTGMCVISPFRSTNNIVTLIMFDRTGCAAREKQFPFLPKIELILEPSDGSLVKSMGHYWPNVQWLVLECSDTITWNQFEFEKFDQVYLKMNRKWAAIFDVKYFLLGKQKISLTKFSSFCHRLKYFTETRRLCQNQGDKSPQSLYDYETETSGSSSKLKMVLHGSCISAEMSKLRPESTNSTFPWSAKSIWWSSVTNRKKWSLLAHHVYRVFVKSKAVKHFSSSCNEN